MALWASFREIYMREGRRAIRLLASEEDQEVLNAGLDENVVMVPAYSGREARSRRCSRHLRKFDQGAIRILGSWGLVFVLVTGSCGLVRVPLALDTVEVTCSCH